MRMKTGLSFVKNLHTDPILGGGGGVGFEVEHGRHLYRGHGLHCLLRILRVFTDRPASRLRSKNDQYPAKAVSPMQACAVHLCHRSPGRWRVVARTSVFASAKRLGVRAASLGTTPLSQAGRCAEAGDSDSPRESGSCDAGLRLASARPQSKRLARWAVRAREGSGRSLSARGLMCSQGD
jgi:hypothetical protein